MDLLTSDDDFAGGLLIGGTLEFKLLEAAADQGLIEGYASSFGGIDAHGDTIAPGAFQDTLDAHVKAGSAPAMLWNHRRSEPIGKWTGMGEDARGLRVRGQLNLKTEAGKRIHTHVAAGDVSGLSIGWTPNPNGIARDKSGLRTLKSVRLHEVSVVTTPSDHDARITQAKSLSSRGDLEDLLQAGGLPRAAARKIAAAGWPALSGEEPEAPDPRILDLIQKTAAMALELKGIRS